MGDTRTPVKTAAVALGINVVLNLILMWPLKIGGLALATSIAATTNFVALYVLLNKRIGDIGTSQILASLGRICVSTAVMGAFTFVMSRMFLDVVGMPTLPAFVRLLFVVLASGLVYFVAAFIVGVEGARKLSNIILKKIK